MDFRPVGRPLAVRFSIIGDSGRPLFPTREQDSLSVDRGGQSDPTESKALAVGRPHGQLKCISALWCMSVDRSVDRQSNFALSMVDRLVDQPWAKSLI